MHWCIKFVHYFYSLSIVVALLLSDPVFASSKSLNFEDKIIDLCPNLCNNSSRNEEDLFCLQGCQNVNLGLSQGCHLACNATSQEEIDDDQENCINGCQSAGQVYVNKVNELGILDVPRLVTDSLNSTSLKLTWKPPDLPLAISVPNFVLQASNLQAQTDWFDVREVNSNVITVENLIPYTKYQFRIVWRLYSYEIISNNSLVMRTKAGGKPSKPIIVSINKASFITNFIVNDVKILFN